MMASINTYIDVVLDHAKSSTSERLEILYDGYYYDVTEFVDRHPGGSVIQFYTTKGEDATAAIQQFHYRSKGTINLILKSFKRRVATDIEDSKKQKRHQALTDDFTSLFLEIQKEGLFNPSYMHVLRRITESLFWIYIGINLVQSSSILFVIVGCFSLAFGTGQYGFIMHEGGHNSLTGNKNSDKFLQSVICGVIGGLSAGWWNNRHQKHHAMPQRLDYDMDLMESLPLLAYNAKVCKDLKMGKTFWIQNQKWLFLSVDCMIINFAVKLYDCPKFAIEKRNWLELSMMLLYWYLVLKFLTLPSFILFYWIQGNYIFGNFFLGHSYLPITEDNTHWVEYGFQHTANVNQSWLVDWFMGYLNLQIEHHLFPTLPQFRIHLIVDRVKALAQKHDLPYQSFSYLEAWRKCLDNLDGVSKELKHL